MQALMAFVWEETLQPRCASLHCMYCISSEADSRLGVGSSARSDSWGRGTFCAWCSHPSINLWGAGHMQGRRLNM